MDEAFVKEQERLRKKKLPDEIYDVTAWSLPLSFNVECVAAKEASQGSFEPVKPERTPAGRVVSREHAIAYLVPWGTQAAGRFLAAALRKNLSVMSSDKPFVNNGRKYPAGSLVLKLHDNPGGLAATVEEMARATGAEVHATDSGWMDEGVNFGSRRVVRLRKPAIALAWDRPTSSSSAGWTRFVLERQFNYPVTIVRTQTLAQADLSKFHVIILPDGSGDYGFGGEAARKLKDWVASGGTLVAVGGAVSFLARPGVGLLAVSPENVARPGADPKKPESPKPDPAQPRVPGKLLANEEEYLKAIQPENEAPDAVVGVMAKARLDSDHWMTEGLPETVPALVGGRTIFTPVKQDKGVNAAVFVGADKLVASGYMWEENRKQLAYKPLVIVQREGRGQVIAFTADPNFRAMMDGLNMLFVNAVFRGPGRTRGAAAEEELH
jgi:hypothetical protein